MSSSQILKGPRVHPELPNESLGALMYQHYEKNNPNDQAILNVDTGEFYTYANLLEYSRNLGAQLKKLGVKSGDIIGVVSENSHKVIVAVLAGLYLGAPVHMINPKYTTYELEHAFKLSQPTTIFCWNYTLKKLSDLQENGLKPIDRVISFEEETASGSNFLYEELIKIEGVLEIDRNFNTEDKTALIFNSSGTTGLPKGVMLSHNALTLNLFHATHPDIYDLRPGENTILILPFYHSFGFIVLEMFTSVGARVLIMEKFAPVKFTETLERYRVEKLVLVPALVDCFAKIDLTPYTLNVKEIFSGGGSISVETSEKICEKFKIPGIRNAYGSTESTSTVSITPRHVDHIRSVGKLCPGRQLKIIDCQTGENLGANQQGHVLVGGYVMQRYINDKEKSMEAFDHEGFYYTGDLGYYDRAGNIYITDRIKDIIKYKGFQVSPIEIETVLMKSDNIKDVAVVGRADRRFGELPVAFVVLKSNRRGHVTEDQIKSHVARYLNIEKQLHGGVRFVDEIPKDAFGKIQKKELRHIVES